MGLDYIRLVLCWLVLFAVIFTGGKSLVSQRVLFVTRPNRKAWKDLNVNELHFRLVGFGTT